MVDFIRKIVSGPKKRYQKDGYNLDLTYVTDRIIGMSFPGEGLEKLYRNSLEQVAKFIKDSHGTNYLIFNLSCRTYNYEKFGGSEKIKSYQWEDHHSPPMHMLFDICHEMHKFLKEDEKNVVIVHCKAGKGRTGTVICCYFLYCGIFNDPDDALFYYGKKRFFKDGLGVNQPCQKRYVREYFWQILKNKITKQPAIYPTVKYIKLIRLIGRPRFTDDGCKPYFEVYDVHKQKLILTTKKSNKEQRRFEVGEEEYVCLFNEIELSEKNKSVHSDLFIKIKDNCKWTSDTKMGRVALNTTFLDKSDEIVFNLSEISPGQTLSDKRFPANYQIKIEFQKNHCSDTVYTPFEELCSGVCSQEWNKDKEGKQNWQLIYKILEDYQKPEIQESRKLLFGNGQDDTLQVLQMSKKTKFHKFETIQQQPINNNDYISQSSPVDKKEYFPSQSEINIIEKQKNQKLDLPNITCSQQMEYENDQIKPRSTTVQYIKNSEGIQEEQKINDYITQNQNLSDEEYDINNENGGIKKRTVTFALVADENEIKNFNQSEEFDKDFEEGEIGEEDDVDENENERFEIMEKQNNQNINNQQQQSDNQGQNSQKNQKINSQSKNFLKLQTNLNRQSKIQLDQKDSRNNSNRQSFNDDTNSNIGNTRNFETDLIRKKSSTSYSKH